MYEKKAIPQYPVHIVRTEVHEEQDSSGDHNAVGLEKPIEEFLKKNYIENYIQCILDCIPAAKRNSIVIGGGGDKYSKIIAEKATQICAANMVTDIYVGKGALFIRPAFSHFIRVNNLCGGIFIYECPDHYEEGVINIGIQFLSETGGPPSCEAVFQVFEACRNIVEYKIMLVKIPLEEVHDYSFHITPQNVKINIHIIDPVKDYLEFLKTAFDFKKIKDLFDGKILGDPFEMLIDCKNGAAGPYARKIFEQELGARKGTAINCKPTDDYNLKYFGPEIAYSLPIANLLINGNYDMGVVIDGNGGRSAIFGKGAKFVPHGDSFAIIVSHYHNLHLFQTKIVKGIARSLYVSDAVDPIAQKLGITLYETPEGWRYFNFLFESKLISICADSDFGMGAYHIREKDGFFTIMAWLSTIVHLRKSLREILLEHWQQNGRNFTSQYIYNNVPRRQMQMILNDTEAMVTDPMFRIKTFKVAGITLTISNARLFEYVNPVNNIPYKDDGVLILTSIGRIVIKVSTYDLIAQFNIILEIHSDSVPFESDTKYLTNPLAMVAMYVTKIPLYTRRKKPNQIY